MDDFRPMMDPTAHSDVDHAFQSQLLTDLSTGIEAPPPPPIPTSGFPTGTEQPVAMESSESGQSIFAATAAAIAAVSAVDGTAMVGNPIAAIGNNGTYSMPPNEMDTYQMPTHEQPLQQQQEQQQHQQQQEQEQQQPQPEEVHYGNVVAEAEGTATDDAAKGTAVTNVESNEESGITESTETPAPATIDDDLIKSKNENQEEKSTDDTDAAKANNNNNNNDGDGDGNGDGNDANNDDEQNDDSTSQLRELRREEDIDPNQCRVCMTNTNLLDIFRIGDRTSFRICDLIMKLVPNVKISERDYLPHQICSVCVDRIEAAYELRIQCEKTDELLRSKLKRSKKTTRRAPAQFLLVDAESSESDDDQKSDDEEFKLSDGSEESSESESSDSSYDDKKKRTTNQRSGGSGSSKRGGGTPFKRAGNQQVVHQPMKKARTAGVVYIKAVNDDEPAATVPRKPGPKSQTKGPFKPGPNNRLAFRCDVCNRPCSSAEALAQHRRTHTDEKCGICSMIFKNKPSLLQHMQRHKEDPNRICKKCHRVFITKAECQRHIQTAHAETVACNRCRRYFPNRTQLDAHKCMSDRKTMDVKPRRSELETSGSGQDLFKSVAPLTTTYWSDSFSD